MLSVLYDGSCPLCAREIAMYRRQHGTDAIRWLDVKRGQKVTFRSAYRDKPCLRGSTSSGATGQQLSERPGSLELWKAIPKLRLVGRLASLPPVLSILELGYSLFLCVRPTIQKCARTRLGCLDERS